MLTSRHQTVNERRASAASRRAFLKFRRASRQNRKRGDCHSLVANVERDSFIGHFDSAASIFVWSQTSSSWLPCQSPERDHTSSLTQATRVLLPRRIQSVRLRRVDSPIPEAPGNAPGDRKPPRSPREGSASPQAPALRARTSIFPLRRPSRLFSASLRAPRSAHKPD